MQINKNNSSVTLRYMGLAQDAMERSSQRLSSGSRINRASDDAAGLAIVATLDAMVKQFDRANLNIADGNSLTQIAGAAVSRMGEIETRKQELAMQASNGVYSDEQRAALDQEYQSLTEEQDRIIGSAQFNGQKIFNDSATSLQVGPGSDSGSRIEIPGMNGGGMVSRGSLTSVDSARAALESADDSLDAASATLGRLGAIESRLQQASESAATGAIAARAAASPIRDADIATEAAQYTKSSILLNAGTAIQAQANQQSQLVLMLLK